VNCSRPEGELFCSGEYVDTGDHLSKCADALAAALNIHVDASASGSCNSGSSVDGGGAECSGEAKASVSACSTSPQENPHTPPVAPGMVVLGAIGAAIARRVRRGGS
jgi:MYXO-CTERM domain-containing protein